MLESFPMQLFEIADVSLVEGTIAVGNYRFFFNSPRNGIEEADGSIPFSSTLRKRAKRIRFRAPTALSTSPESASGWFPSGSFGGSP
jgi:hypothetical protein